MVSTRVWVGSLGGAVLSVVFWACTEAPAYTPSKPVTASTHASFPISAGAGHALGKVTAEGTIGCESCHLPSSDAPNKVVCDQCHKHTERLTQRLHLGLDAGFPVDTSAVSDPTAKAELRGAACYACHPTGEPRDFSHARITGECAECHAPTNAFAALPVPGFTHPDIGATDCSACHVTSAWTPASAVPSNVFDPTRTLTVQSQLPTWSGTVITAVTPNTQLIPMTMNHGATALDPAVLSNCTGCHAQADQGQFYPGVMHWSLTNLGLPQPTTCDECHGSSGPRGFVGALDARRSPSTGEMKHDAVAWSGGAPTAAPVITTGCVTCHQAPNERFDATWKFANGRDDGGAVFHRSLTEGGQPQPTACLDCHANSRPVTPVQTASFVFDHSAALGECAGCHASTTSWSGGVYHSASAPAPTTCLPCHAAERPTSTTGWQGNFSASPFDYGTNANGVGHGADQDCVVCHRGPGTGAWNGTQNWQGGHFDHAATSLAATTCVDCHSTQRPDLLSPPADAGFDHAASGTGDCVGCHQDTMTRRSFVNLYPIPGGDWRGGKTYPGNLLISTPNQSVRVQSTRLTRTGNLVTGATTSTVTLPNAFLHTSTAIPAAVNPGTTASGDPDSCWHCHTSVGTTVTAFANGRFHAALSSYRATPDAGITALPQPTTCNDCHAQMRPPNIVQKTDAGVGLLPMDHAASYMGATGSGVPSMDCGACHRTPGLGPTQWSDGRFHANLPTGATPSECVNCHYPLMVTASADVTSPATPPSTYAMKHRAPAVTTHACASCHAGALAKATMTPAAALWRPGTFHPQANPQPTGCLDCHASSAPTMATQGTVIYTLTQGGTATNGAQWMNHADATVVGRDCVLCHAADARTSGSAWSKSAPYHSKVSAVTACATCHGLTNGRGSVVGTNNNLPAGLIDTATVTTSSAAPANTPDQISHADSNVTRFDCSFCHTQVGPSTTSGVQGKEWSIATFHRRFTAGNPLVMNGTTGRCSNCHLNVKPGASFTAHDHSAYGATGTDCSSCHSWPGTNPTTPNWKGATGGHASSGPTATSLLDCNTCHGQGGSSRVRLTVAASAHYGGISNGNKCTSCHIEFSGFKGPVTNLKYGHTNATANAGNGCANCHVFTNQLYTLLTTTPSLTRPTVAGGRQFSQLTSVTGTFDGDSFTAAHTNANLARCGSCHQYATTTATTNVWSFKHRPSNPGITGASSKSAAGNVVGCNMCH